MVKVVVEFDYKASEPDELTLSKGDIISNVRKLSGGWWEGTLNGRVGMFPDNFVKEIADVPSNSKSTGLASNFDSKPDGIRSMPSNAGTIGRVAAPLPKGVKKAVVTFAYTPQHADELLLQVGDVIEITKQVEEGWWEGRLRGKQGMFPSNFVQIIPESEFESHDGASGSFVLPTGNVNPTSTNAELKVTGSSSTDSLKSKTGKPNGSALADVTSSTASPARSSSKAGAERPTTIVPRPALANPAAAASPTALYAHMSTTAAAHAAKKKALRAKVLYAYYAQNEDELTLVEGAVVTVLSQQFQDAGWWQGELNGRIGVFPDNFVELIQQPEAETAPSLPAKAKVEPLPVDRGLPPDEPPKDFAPPRPVKTSATVGSLPRQPHPEVNSHLASKREPPLPSSAAALMPSLSPQTPPALPAKPAARPVPPAPASTSVAMPPPHAESKQSVAMSSDARSLHSASADNGRAQPEIVSSGPTKVQGEENYHDELDSVGSTPTLSNVTATRPKNPNRRPPTSPGLKREDSVDTSGFIAGPSGVNGYTSAANAKGSVATRAAPDSFPPPPQPAADVRPVDGRETADATATSAAAVEELRREVADLSAALGKQRDVVAQELQLLRESMAAVRDGLEQRVAAALTELAEEKRLRVATLADVELLREQAFQRQLQA